MDIALDIGQTRLRARIARGPGSSPDGSGEIPEVTLPGAVYGTPVVETLGNAVLEIARNAGLGAVDTVAAGCTGLYGEMPAIDALAERLRANLGVRRVIVADDAVTCYLGAMGSGDGVVVAPGTGMVAFGLGPLRAARVDGAGAMIGDEGAGWWIGRAGIIAALSAFDGRSGGSGALLAAAQSRYGPAASIARIVATATSPIAAVAAFARDVADVARAGDDVARSIWARAAAYMADCVVAAGRRSGQSPRMRWALTGNLGNAGDLIDEPVERAVRAAFPDAERVVAAGSPLDGSQALLTREDLSSLRPFVVVHPG